MAQKRFRDNDNMWQLLASKKKNSDTEGRKSRAGNNSSRRWREKCVPDEIIIHDWNWNWKIIQGDVIRGCFVSSSMRWHQPTHRLWHVLSHWSQSVTATTGQILFKSLFDSVQLTRWLSVRHKSFHCHNLSSLQGKVTRYCQSCSHELHWPVHSIRSIG